MLTDLNNKNQERIFLLTDSNYVDVKQVIYIDTNRNLIIYVDHFDRLQALQEFRFGRLLCLLRLFLYFGRQA